MAETRRTDAPWALLPTDPRPAEMPPEDPGARLHLLRTLHAVLCQTRHAATPEEHSGAALCWRALAAVDWSVGDIDELIVDLNRRTDDIQRNIAASAARRSRLEEAMGLTPPAIEGQVVQQVCPDCESPFHGPPCPRVRSLP